MAKNSRNKGAAFERKIAGALSRAMGVTLRRTPLSGGWADSPDVAGDLVCVEPGPEAFPYCVECKNGEDWRLESLFTDKHSWFDGWWAQAINECPPGQKPVLVFSRNFTPELVAVRLSDFPNVDCYRCLYIPQKDGELAILALEDFMCLLSSSVSLSG